MSEHEEIIKNQERIIYLLEQILEKTNPDYCTCDMDSLCKTCRVIQNKDTEEYY